MKWVVNSDACDFEVSSFVEAANECELEEVLKDELADQLCDIIRDITSEYSCKYKTALSLDDVENGLLSYIKEQIRLKYSSMVIHCTSDDEEEPGVSFPLSEMALSYLDWCWDGSDTVYPKVGKVVEKMLEEYVSKSTWNIALHSESGEFLLDCEDWPTPLMENGKTKWLREDQEFFPIIWYGPEDEDPILAWTIWDGANLQSDLSDNPIPCYWFDSNTWDTIENLINDTNDAFLIWYTAECGFVAPALDEIIETCPVEFSGDELCEEAYKKISQYFFAKYLASRYGEIQFDAYVYSEKANVGIGFGFYYEPLEYSVEDIGTDWIWEGMGDSFWENAQEFEEGAGIASQLLNSDGSISYKEALFQVFGSFTISIKCNAPELKWHFDIDDSAINEAMYSMLPDVYVE